MRRSKLCFFVICAISLVFVLGVTFLLREVASKLHVVCSAAKIRKDIDELCAEFRSGAVAGSLCDALCTSKTVRYDSCVSAHFEKDEVFLATLPGDVKVVIKSVRFSNHSLSSHLRSAKVSQYLKTQFSMPLPLETRIDDVRRMWHRNKNNNNKKKNAKFDGVAMDSLWSVLQSREFAALNLFRDDGLVPAVRGICGNFYAVEKLHPMSFPSMLDLARPTPQKWKSNLEAALKLVDFARKLEELNLLYCDVKSVHFGLSSEDGGIRILDADKLMPRKRADNLSGSGKLCSSHSTCDVLDCRGYCSEVRPGKSKCLSAVTNNNLQMVCEKLFQGWYRELHLTFPGLLASRLASQQLRDAVNLCANPTASTDERRFAANETVEKNLVRVIKMEIEKVET